MKKRSFGSNLFDCLNVLFFAFVAVIMLFPLWNVLMMSFVDVGEFYSRTIVLWPRKFYFDSYKYIFSGKQFLDAIYVTVFTTIVGSVYSLFMTTTLSYGLSKKYLPGRKFFLLLIIITMFFSGGLIPDFLLIKRLGLMNSLAAIILPAAVAPFYFIIIKTFFTQLPAPLEEAAKIDGASDIAVFIRIILPISTPVLATFLLFYAVIYWNQWFQSLLYIQDRNLRPLQLILREMVVESARSGGGMEVAAVKRGMDRTDLFEEGIKMVTVIVATVPILIVYPFLQKYFAKGVILGSIKG